MFDKILIANRGEIAVRIARTCRERGVTSVAVHSDVDATARHVRSTDEAVHLPGVAPTETYLDVERVLEAATTTGAEAIHPGYGFLSENADFAEAVVGAGLAWIGPPATAIRAVGDKVSARKIATSAGVPVVPGTLEPIEDPALIVDFGREHGYPLAIKASGGGGGRGLRVARSADEVTDAFASARRESQAYFSSTDVYVERYLEAPKHLEVQLLAPGPDEAMWLGVRDCSLQRRHQKLVEETPPPLFAERAADMGAAAVALSKACGYVNAGTVEMLVDADGSYYFLEVNSRLQVEHTVTEEVLGLDLVACQLQIAAGDALGFTQDDLLEHMNGHSIECRINAEDATRGFLPSPGRIETYSEPNGLGVRVDSGYSAGDSVPEAYDSLIAKVITWGNDREEARVRMIRSLQEMVIEGIETTIPAHLALLDEPSFVKGDHTTRTIEGGGVLDHLAQSVGATEEEANVLLVQGRAVRLWNESMAASASAAVHSGGGGDLVAPMQGTILKVLVEPGAEVEAGDAIVVLEAMKMETTIAAPRSGRVSELSVAEGESVGAGQVVAVLE
ncbi:MAG TPA: biotin carboxylase N-terminal domain-containing protein [Actinomycetota bacterium]|nr:biotin carboxylase N-terminal domain-containing protein [Actinomycetota bacterium]